MNHRHRLTFGIVITMLSATCLTAQDIPQPIIEKVQQATVMEDGCHPVAIDGKNYVVCIDEGQIETLQRSVIPSAILHSDDSVYMKFVEEAYAAFLLDMPSPRFGDIDIKKGTWASLDKLDKDIRCETRHDKKSFTVSIFEGKTLFFTLWSPINYRKFNAGTRTEIENRFIKGLLHYVADSAASVPDMVSTDLRPTNDTSIFILPGDSYLSKHINNNTYVAKGIDGNYSFIVDPQLPVATIANMMILGIGYQALLDMTISIHEYGSTAKTTVTLDQFRQYCIKSGCKLFWAFESNESDELKGTLFCSNEKEGYEHIVRLTCRPADLGSEHFTMTARVSLYVPTTNVSDTY